MSEKTLRRAIFCAGLLLLFSIGGNHAALHAQSVSNATITGRITDEQGAVAPGARIQITGVDTGAVYTAVSNADGIYTIPNLPIGPYTLQAVVPGFQTYVQTGIVLRVGDNVQINVTMKVGTIAEKVEVSANASLVQTQQNTISQVIDQQRIVDLPLNGRDPTELITISGASINHSDGTNTGSKSFFSSQSVSIAGGAGNTTNYLLDGGDNNDSFTNVNMPFPFPDALAEFSVETSTLPARNGLHPGGVVNAVTKSGHQSLARRSVRVPSQRRRERDQLLRAPAGQPEAQPVRRHGRRPDHPRQAVLLRRLSAVLHPPGPVVEHGLRSDRRGARRRFQRAGRAGCQAKGVARVVNDPTTGTAAAQQPDQSYPFRPRLRRALASTCPRHRIPAARFLTAFRCNRTTLNTSAGSIG